MPALKDVRIGVKLYASFAAVIIVLIAVLAAMANTLSTFEQAVIEAEDRALTVATRVAALEAAPADLREGADALVATMDATRGIVGGAVWDAVMIAVGAALFAGLAAVAITRAVAGPVTSLTQTMQRLADGDWEVAVEHADRGDEVGAMARTVEVFKRNGLENARLRAEQEAAKAREAEQRQAVLSDLAGRFETAVGAVIKTVVDSSGTLETNARTMSGTAENTSEEAVRVYSASQTASENVQMVGAATEELNATTTEIAEQVNRATGVAKEAQGAASRTSELVDGLNNASSRIGEVIGLISDIAEQTNLLALNATIEAARAGEAGRGFAVVAQEVKNLATQTGSATGEIGGQIENMRGIIDEAVRAMTEISATIERITEANVAISGAVEEQSATTREIARNIATAVEAVRGVSNSMQVVSDAAADTGTASADVTRLTEDLARQAQVLETEVGRFLGEVRAG